MGIECCNLNAFEDELKDYIPRYDKSQYLLVIQRSDDIKERHITINFCKSLGLVKKMVKKYINQTKGLVSALTSNTEKYFLFEFGSDSLPYILLKTPNTIDIKGYSIALLEKEIKQ